MHCYNCGDSTHRSKDCSKPAMYSRCPCCNSVASSPAGHKNFCTTKEFESSYLGSTATVFELKDLMTIDFKDVESKISALDGAHEIEIGETPLWLAAADCFVSKAGILYSVPK